MAKRFIDSAIWEKTWFRKLSPAHKCAWVYILSRCDAVGVWDADTELAEFCIGEKVDWDAFQDACNGNIEILESGKWWVIDYCKFQYGELSEASRPHQSYIKLLASHRLLERVCKGYTSPIGRAKEKEKEKEKDKDKEKDIASSAREVAPNVRLSQEESAKLEAEFGKDGAADRIEKLSLYKGSTGKRYKSDYMTILSWDRKENGRRTKRPVVSTEKICETCGETFRNQSSICPKCGAPWSPRRTDEAV